MQLHVDAHSPIPTRRQLAEQVKHFIWTLRKKIEADPGDPQHLITERGFGYRFE